MPKLSLQEVDHIAHLSRLSLDEAEKEMFRHQLSAILEYVEVLNSLDTSGVIPTTSALPLSNVMRPDEVTASLDTEDVLSNAPDAADDQFRVRAILE